MSLARQILRGVHVVNRSVGRVPAENRSHFIASDCQTNWLFAGERDQSDLPKISELSIQHRVNLYQKAIAVARRRRRIQEIWIQKLSCVFVGVQIDWLLGGNIDSEFIVRVSLYLNSEEMERGKRGDDMEINEDFNIS